MHTRTFYIITAAVFAAILFCILPLEKLQPVEAEPRTYWEDTETASCTEAPEEDNPLDPYEVELIGRTIWGEAEGVNDKAEQAAVAWCILNRVDDSGKTIEEVVTAPNQFQGFYRVTGEVPEHFLQLAEDVLLRWRMEKAGADDVGRVLPADYLFFIGDGARNYFSKEWKATDYWGWTLKSPY
jgi:hypothetical protein